jgi:hypothetical protein
VQTRTASVILSVPAVANILCWLVLFRYPMLGFRESLATMFGWIEFVYLFGFVGAVSNYFREPRSRHARVCLLLNLCAVAYSAYGLLFGLGMVIRAFS